MAVEDFDEQRLSLTWARNKVDESDRSKIVDCYRQWVNQPLYYITKKHGESERDAVYQATRARKRGDVKYERETNRRFKIVCRSLKGIRVRISRKSTSGIMVTLTYKNNNTAKWNEVGGDFNKFMAGLRKRYGRVLCVRVWEAHKSGLPHIHALLLFEQHDFRCFSFRGKLRIENKDDVAGLWPFGFTDILGIYDIGGAIGYFAKYLRKALSLQLRGSLITLAMLWYHRKRMFAISRDLMTDKRNSNQGTWSFIGICTSRIDLEKVWIQEAWKTDKGVKVVWEKQKQLSLDAIIAEPQ